MRKLINSALLEIQAATLARSLYPSGHPRIRSSEARAIELLEKALDRQSEVTVFLVGNRVIFADEPLSSSTTLGASLFRLLKKRGLSQIAFRRGLGAEELRSFLDKLADTGDARSDVRLDSPHVSVGAVVNERLSPAEPEPHLEPEVSEALQVFDDAACSLAETWQGFHDETAADIEKVGDIVATLHRVVHDRSHTFLPLANLKSHDEYTFGHIVDVAILSMSLGEALGFGGKATHELGIAALLHDVGKTAIAPEVLNKKGKFTDEEFKVMQSHTTEGARMLLQAERVPELAAVVAFEHHVKLDGTGYPKVPPGWKLNLASRICQVADVYDALRTDRPYRKGMPVDQIVRVMKGDVGTYFDADLLQIFLDRVVPQVTPVSAGAEPS